MTFLEIQTIALYYWLTAGAASSIKEAIYYRKINKELDSIFLTLILTCFFFGFILLPAQIYNWVWAKWNRKL